MHIIKSTVSVFCCFTPTTVSHMQLFRTWSISASPESLKKKREKEKQNRKRLFCLSGTCWVSLFSLSLVSLLIIDLAWHFSFPWPSPFFILLEINYNTIPLPGIKRVTITQGVHFRHLQTRVFRPGVVCVVSVYFIRHLIFRVCFFMNTVILH